MSRRDVRFGDVGPVLISLCGLILCVCIILLNIAVLASRCVRLLIQTVESACHALVMRYTSLSC